MVCQPLGKLVTIGDRVGMRTRQRMAKMRTEFWSDSNPQLEGWTIWMSIRWPPIVPELNSLEISYWRVCRFCNEQQRRGFVRRHTMKLYFLTHSKNWSTRKNTDPQILTWQHRTFYPFLSRKTTNWEMIFPLPWYGGHGFRPKCGRLAGDCMEKG